MEPRDENRFTTPDRGLRTWRRSILGLVLAWGRHQIWSIVAAIGALWAISAGLLHLVEPASNAAFATWGEALWNVLGTIFGAGNAEPETIAGRIVAGTAIVSGVALSGLFTASVASILIDRALRSRQVSSLEMSEHLVLCNWAPRGLELIREVHSNIVADKRPVVIIHDNPDDIALPDKQDDPAFSDVYIVKGDPANEVILRRAKVAQAHSVIILSDDRQGEHADGKSIVCCIAARQVCRSGSATNIIVECRDPKYRHHMRKAGADEVMSAADFGLRLIARAALYHGMTRVYQELLTVGRDANEMYMLAVPDTFVGMNFVEASQQFMKTRSQRDTCLLIGIWRGEKMMLNPLDDEFGKLREGDELILLSQVLPDLSRFAKKAD